MNDNGKNATQVFNQTAANLPLPHEVARIQLESKLN
jgi:hypothetical protein